MEKITLATLPGLMKRPGRHGLGQGLFFRTLGDDKAYWVYRYRANGKEREMSLGPYPELTLLEARAKHAELRKRVVADKGDPLGEKRGAKDGRTTARAVPTFGEVADDYIAAHEAGWRNAKHRDQWKMTLATYCNAIRSTPVDQIDAAAVLSVLRPLWTRTPETASRLRGRIEAVLDDARVLGHIDADRANPARWKGHLQKLLPNPKKIVSKPRGHHAAMPYADLPAFMATLNAAPGVAPKALAFLILTCARSNEVFGMTWDEVQFAIALKQWTIPAERMKMEEEHRVPLSPAATDILRRQLKTRGKNPHVFPSYLPRQPLSTMALAMTMRRLGKGDFTVHGMRSTFRDWATEVARADYDVAERCLAHKVGSQSSLSYDRSDRFDLRRELMERWAAYVAPTASGDAKSNRKR
jgi:integrase